MKRRTVLWSVPVLLAAVFALDRAARPTRPTRPPEARPTIGEHEEAGARSVWEHLRLQEPASGRIPPGMRARELAFAQRQPKRGRSNEAISLTTFASRGPWNVGGRTRSLALDASDPTTNTMLAGGISGGVWRTENGGTSWQLTTGSDDFIGATCVAQDLRSGHTGTWYYGTGEYLGTSASGSGAYFLGRGIFKSGDGGRSWAQLASTIAGSPTGYDNPFDFVFRVATDRSNAGQEEVYAATASGILRSLDGGASWTLVLDVRNGTVGYRSTDLAISSTGVLYATIDSGGPNGGVFRSSDGVSWINITPPGLGGTYGRMAVALAGSDERVLYLLADAGSGPTAQLWKYTYVSGDGSGSGGSWENRSAGLDNIPVPVEANSAWDFNAQGGYDLLVAVKPDDPNFVVIGGVHLIRSTDGFATSSNRKWIGGWLYPDPNASVHHADQHAFVFHPTQPAIAWSGSDGGVWRTDNIAAASVNWTSRNDGYRTTQFYTLALDASTPGSAVLIGGLQDNGTWWSNQTELTAPWLETFGGDGAFCAVANGATVGGLYYVSAQFGVTYLTEITSQGQTTNRWTRVDPQGVQESEYLFVNPFVLDPNDSRVMYLASRIGLWRNRDLTTIPNNSNSPAVQNWTHLTTSGSVSAIVVSRTPPNLVYYGTSDGFLYKVPNALQAPGGTTPTQITNVQFPAGAYITALACNPDDGNQLLVGFSNYGVSSLFYSSNAGTSWTDVEGNLGGADGPSVRSLSILPVDQGFLYLVGTSTGLYSTSTLAAGGTVWQQEATAEIGNLVVDAVVTRSSDGTIAVGTHGGGAFVGTASGGGQTCATRSGDANGDNSVNVLDVTRVVNHILEINLLSEAGRICANVQADDRIDILDVVGIVRIILEGAPLAEHDGADAFLAAAATIAAAKVQTSYAGEQYRVDFEAARLAGIEAMIRIPSGFAIVGTPTVEAAGGANAVTVASHVDGGRLRLVAYDPSLDTASAGPSRWTVVVSLREVDSANPRLTRGEAPELEHATVSDVSAREIPWDRPESREGFSLRLAPNPTRGVVTASFELPRAAEVELSIHDAGGRLLRSMRSEGNSGTSALRWDGRDDRARAVPNGTYFVRISSLGRSEARSVQVLR